MIIFKLMLIILLAAPFVFFAGFLFRQARNFSVKLNKLDRAMEKEREKRRTGGYF